MSQRNRLFIVEGTSDGTRLFCRRLGLRQGGDAFYRVASGCIVSAFSVVSDTRWFCSILFCSMCSQRARRRKIFYHHGLLSLSIICFMTGLRSSAPVCIVVNMSWFKLNDPNHASHQAFEQGHDMGGALLFS